MCVSALIEAAGSSVPKFEEYQKQAAACLRLAQEVSNPTNKAMLPEMTQAWIRLAEQELAAREKGQK
jgi:hypothetical protein